MCAGLGRCQEKYGDTSGELLPFLAWSQFCNFGGHELEPTSASCSLHGLEVGGYWDRGWAVLWPDLASQNQNLQAFMTHKLLGEARKSGCCGNGKQAFLAALAVREAAQGHPCSGVSAGPVLGFPLAAVSSSTK